MKTTLLSFITLLTVLTFVVPQAQARGDKMEAAKERMQEKREAKKEKREEKTDAACERMEERIANKITNFDNTHKMHVRQYEMMKEKIGKVILEMSAKGKDVSKLRTDLATLNTKIEKFNTDRVAFIDALKKTQEYACGDSQGAFKDALTAAQAKHKTVLADEKDIRSFYNTTIRADLKALRD
jgi:hypothetical protein